MEVNVQAVYACRKIGSGYNHLQTFCCYMNIPKPMRNEIYMNRSSLLAKSCKSIAEKTMSNAANALRGPNDQGDIGVSGDGTWQQRKGFTSKLGVITAIAVDSGKVIDTAILSKSCKGCMQMEALWKTDPVKYQKRKMCM